MYDRNTDGNEMSADKEGWYYMAVAVKKDYQAILIEHNKEVRNLVMEGLQQVKEGKTKDFNAVCDRLEKKYSDEAVQD